MNLYKITSKYTNILDKLYDMKDSIEYKNYKEALLQYLEFDNTIEYIMNSELDMTITEFEGFKYNNPKYKNYTNEQILNLPSEFEPLQIAIADTRLCKNVPYDIEKMYNNLSKIDFNGLFIVTWIFFSMNENLNRDQIELLYDCYIKSNSVLLVKLPYLKNLSFKEIENSFYELTYKNLSVVND